MALKDTAFKVLKKGGNGFNKTANWLQYGSKGKRANPLGDTILKKTFKKVDKEDADTLAQKVFGIKLTKPAAIIGSAGVVAYTVGGAFKNENHKGRMGEIQAEQVVNTISQSTSPGIVDIADRINEDENSVEEIAKTSISKTQSGVDPSIVFALHELRK